MTYIQFRKRWDRAPEIVREWMRHKAMWEHMSLWAIANEWGFPTAKEAQEWLGNK